MTFLPLILRHWRLLIGLAAAGILSLLVVIRTAERDDARQELASERRERALLAAETRARGEEIARRFTENARRIENAQARINQEVSNDYQSRVRDLNRRADALRMRRESPKPDPHTLGEPRMPGVSEPAPGIDGAAIDHGLSLEERITATAQAIRLEELQRWLREQLALVSTE